MTRKKPITRAKNASMPKTKSRLKNAKTATINVRVDPKTKAKAEKTFAKLGFSMSDGIGMFLQQVIHHKGIPFELRVPNAATRKAMREAMEDKNMTTYASTKEMWQDLLK